MAQSIESFVGKLHDEGVQAGRQEARRIVEEAKVQAERIVSEAAVKADAVVKEAKAQAQRLAERQRSELDLAARDTVLKFREALNHAIGHLLALEVDKALTDPKFLLQLIHDTVVNYARQDAQCKQHVEINVNPKALETVTQWALAYLSQEARERISPHVQLRGTLSAHGFEYKVDESTIEVTVESLTELIKEQVSPQLRQVLDRALGEVLSKSKQG